MKIKYKGEEVEAYDLIIKKEFAKQIVTGEKKLEIRAMSDFNIRKFFDNKKYKDYTENKTDKMPFKEIDFVHLRDYSGNFFVDFMIGRIGVGDMTCDGIHYLQETYDFHDYDNEWQQFVKPCDEEGNDLPDQKWAYHEEFDIFYDPDKVDDLNDYDKVQDAEISITDESAPSFFYIEIAEVVAHDGIV